MMGKRYVLCLGTLMCLTGAPAHAAEMLAPDALAKSVTQEVLAAVKADKDLQSGNSQKVLRVVEAKVLPHFDFEHMTRLAMGRNWRQTTSDQQKTLTSEFRTLLVRTYAAAFTQYRNQTVDYKPIKVAADDSDVIVKSVINQPGSQPMAVDYRMEKTGQDWKVYDVKIEGISLVANYRTTFSAEVQKGGVEGLIQALSEKNRTLASTQVSAK